MSTTKDYIRAKGYFHKQKQKQNKKETHKTKQNNNKQKKNRSAFMVEMTSNAEIRPEEQGEKAGSCRENLWNEIQLKGP